MTRPSLEVRRLTPADEAAFRAGLMAWEGEDPEWYSFVWREGMAYDAMLEVLDREASGHDLAPGRVPATMFYGFVDGVIVGRLSVRHRLNAALERFGGHFGYAVAPRFRRRGYGLGFGRFAIRFCRDELGLSEALATCDDQNLASIRILEALGGRVVDRFPGEGTRVTRRYRFDFR